MELLSKVWPQWKVVKELGEGSFGKVYQIERNDVGGSYQAALKVITIPKNASEISDVLSEGMDMNSATQYFHGMMEEIVKEFAMMERLKGNTNIVAYEDHEVISREGSVGWDILIRMELLTPLSDYMMKHTLGEKDVIKLGIDLCKALELCQQYNIIHRDIKPENIFVSELGDFKLGDFGVARTAEKTMSGMSKKGTYTYMAPEVYKGEAYNSTVDLYSLGIVLYRLVNDYRTPFLPPAPQMITFNDRERAQLRRMEGESFPDPTKGSRALTEIIRKAAAYQPKDRYASPAQMRADLEALLVGEKTYVGTAVVVDEEDKTVSMSGGVIKQPVSAMEEEEKTVSMAAAYVQPEKQVSVVKQAATSETQKKKNPALFAGIGVAALALVVGGVVLLGGSGGSDKPEPGSIQSNISQDSNVGDSMTDPVEAVVTDVAVDVTQLDYNILASELVYDEEGYQVVAEGKEAAPHDNSMYPPISLLGEWVFEAYGSENASHLAPGTQMTIAEGTPRETQWECLPYTIEFKAYNHNDNYNIDIEDRHIDGMYCGEMSFLGSVGSIDGTFNEAYPDIIFDTHENILAVGIPYTQEHVGWLDSGAETTYIQELQYEMEWVGWKLKLTCGDYSATYVPYGMHEDSEDSFYVSMLNCVADSEPFEGIERISKWEFINPEEKASFSYYFPKSSNIYATTEFREDGTVKIVTEEREYGESYFPPATYELQYRVSSYALTLISEGKYYIYADGGSWLDRYMAQFVQGDIDTADEDTVTELLEIRDGFIEELKFAFDAYGIDVTVDEESGKVNLDSSILFAHDESELSQEGKAFLDNFVAAYWFAMGSCTEAGYVSEILVEGHTDTNGSYDYNLVLSKERADSVANYCLTESNSGLDAAQVAQLAEMMTTIGRSYDEPVYHKDGTVNMDGSRRVVFRFRLSTDV